jgi:hypothetical protein
MIDFGKIWLPHTSPVDIAQPMGVLDVPKWYSNALVFNISYLGYNL